MPYLYSCDTFDPFISRFCLVHALLHVAAIDQEDGALVLPIVDEVREALYVFAEAFGRGRARLDFNDRIVVVPASRQMHEEIRSRRFIECRMTAFIELAIKNVMFFSRPEQSHLMIKFIAVDAFAAGRGSAVDR